MALQDQVLSFQLTNTLSRQVFRYDTGEEQIKVMYDSGAQIPVWCTGKDLLLDAFPTATETELSCEISGFGKENETGRVYEIPLFDLNDGETHFRIEKLMVVELFKPFIGCDFLLSETMLSKTDTTTIRREKRSFNISYSDPGRAFVCTAKRDGKIIKGISVWSHGDIV